MDKKNHRMMNCIPPPLLHPPLNNELLVNVDKIQTKKAYFQEAHVNTCYKHFYYFVTEYNLVDKKELEPLRDMTAKICH